jgi:predicted nucleic acid-binding protein
VDDRVLDEYVEVTSRSEFGFETKDINALISFIETSAIHVQAKLLVERLPDPDDEPFLEVAIAGGADALVTGNLRHFPAKSAQGVRVISPAIFLAPPFPPTER